MSLKNHWYIAATEAAVRKKPQAVQIFGQHYVVFHTQNNQYAARTATFRYRAAKPSAAT